MRVYRYTDKYWLVGFLIYKISICRNLRYYRYCAYAATDYRCFFACLLLLFEQGLTKDYEIDDKDRLPNNAAESKEKNIKRICRLTFQIIEILIYMIPRVVPFLIHTRF